jgi:hypothetical protein
MVTIIGALVLIADIKYMPKYSMRLKTITDTFLLEQQHVLRKGNSTTDNIFVEQQITEKRREFDLEMHIAFIDFEKAFVKIDRNTLCNILYNTATQITL